MAVAAAAFPRVGTWGPAESDELLARDGQAAPRSAADNPLAPKRPPRAAKARSVIYLHMAGSPSQLDLFDYKPTLQKYNGQP